MATANRATDSAMGVIITIVELSGGVVLFSRPPIPGDRLSLVLRNTQAVLVVQAELELSVRVTLVSREPDLSVGVILFGRPPKPAG